MALPDPGSFPGSDNFDAIVDSFYASEDVISQHLGPPQPLPCIDDAGNSTPTPSHQSADYKPGGIASHAASHAATQLQYPLFIPGNLPDAFDTVALNHDASPNFAPNFAAQNIAESPFDPELVDDGQLGALLDAASVACSQTQPQPHQDQTGAPHDPFDQVLASKTDDQKFKLVLSDSGGYPQNFGIPDKIQDPKYQLPDFSINTGTPAQWNEQEICPDDQFQFPNLSGPAMDQPSASVARVTRPLSSREHFGGLPDVSSIRWTRPKSPYQPCFDSIYSEYSTDMGQLTSDRAEHEVIRFSPASRARQDSALDTFGADSTVLAIDEDTDLYFPGKWKPLVAMGDIAAEMRSCLIVPAGGFAKSKISLIVGRSRPLSHSSGESSSACSTSGDLQDARVPRRKLEALDSFNSTDESTLSSNGSVISSEDSPMMLSNDSDKSLPLPEGTLSTGRQIIEQCIEMILQAVSPHDGREYRTLLDVGVYERESEVNKSGILKQLEPQGFDVQRLSCIRDIIEQWKPSKVRSDRFFRLKDKKASSFNMEQLQETLEVLTSRPPRRINYYPAHQIGTDGKIGQGQTVTQIGPMVVTQYFSRDTRRISGIEPGMAEGGELPVRNSKKRQGNIYDPTWVRGMGTKKEGWCDNCLTDGKYHPMKNSGYLYHKNHEHGIFPNGNVFEDPLVIRRKLERDNKLEGLCGICYHWIDLEHTEKKHWGTWYRHYKQCTHEYDEFKKILAATGAPVRLVEICYSSVYTVYGGPHP